MKSGTLDREVLWETPSGKQVRIKSRRLISFRQRHVAAISYEVTLLNAEAPVVISSEMLSQQPGVKKSEADPRQAKIFSGKVLQHCASYAQDRRIVLAHGTERTQMILACAIDHRPRQRLSAFLQDQSYGRFWSGRFHDCRSTATSHLSQEVHGVSHFQDRYPRCGLPPRGMDFGSSCRSRLYPDCWPNRNNIWITSGSGATYG